MSTRTRVAALLIVVSVVWASPSAWAHTEADVIAVPAATAAMVNLKPNHGCGDSPTTEVAIQAPVAGATAGEVDGWTATATAGPNGTTVLEWKGGSLPSDATGTFPVHFTAPGTPGTLLTFPAIQYCANGEELSWISGDPAADYPAPRLLVLPVGSEPAATIDEVPADAPGREQLEQVVEVGPESTTTSEPTTTEPAPASSSPAPTSTTPTVTAPVSEKPAETSDDGNTTLVVIGLGVVAGLAAAAFVVWKRNHRT